MEYEKCLLVTTGLEFDKGDFKKVVYAGDWCLARSKNDLGKDDQILDYPIIPEDAILIQKQISESYEYLLLTLASLYNEEFSLNKPVKFYEIILGRWLYHYLNNIYEKMSILNYGSEKFQNLYVECSNDYFAHSFDSDNYNQQTYLSHHFNFLMFSGIASYLKNISKIYINIEKSEQLVIKQNSIGVFLSNTYQRILSLLNRIFADKLIIVVSPNYPRKTFLNSLWFFFKSKFQIVHCKFDNSQIDKKIDLPLRKKLTEKIELKTINDSLFTRLSGNLIFSFIPQSFFEDFIAKRSQAIQWCDRNKNLKRIFTANSIHTNEGFKYMVAEAPHAELWITQHGFGYGSNQIISSEVYERKLADRYFTWGWLSDKLPNPKLISDRKIYYNDNEDILFTFPSITDYAGILETTMIYSADIKNFTRFSDSLVSHLNTPIKQKIIIRQQKKIGLRLLELESISTEDDIKSFHDSLRRTKLHLSNHYGTPFLETLAMNLPTIVLHKPINRGVRDEAVPYFELLKEAKILFDDPIDAAEHINNIYDNIDIWWLNDKTQKAVKSFCSKYAYADREWKSIWLTTLKEFDYDTN